MKNLVVNIGLNVGKSEPYGQAKATLDVLSYAFDFHSNDYSLQTGQWETEEGVIEERVLVAQINAGMLTPLSVSLILGEICNTINQEAIAFRLNGVGHVVFHKDYQGERFEFNENYFRVV